MPFNPNGNTVQFTIKEVTLHLNWITRTNESEIAGQLRFRGRRVDALTNIDRPCRGSDVGSLLNDLITMAFREFALDAHDTEVVFRPAIREIRDKLAGDYGIT